MKLNYHAFTADRQNSFTYMTIAAWEVGDKFLHSMHGNGIVVHCEKVGIGYKLTIRKDITLDQFIEAL